MKKLYSLILATLIMLAGCGEINDRLDALEGRVDAIENTQIATISQQITSINNSILLLNNTDKELSEYITALEAEAENLQSQITATNTKIDEVKTEVLSTISTEKANILAELEALRNTTITRLEEINATIAELKAADGDMSAQIEALEAEAAQLEVKLAETNTKIDTVKSELTETISTEKANILAELEAFKATVNGELDAIKAVLETLKAKDVELDGKIATLQEYVDTELKVTEDWATATFATLEQYNTVVTTIATIEGNIEGLNESIAALETRINEKIAKDIEAASATLSADLQNAVKEVTEAYTSAIATAKNELTEAYTAAIAAAIAESEGKMSDKLAEEIAAINERIDKSDIAAIEALIANCKARMETAEADIAQLKSDVLQLQVDVEELQEITEKLLAQIQSITYIPTYDDGKATIDYHTKRGTLDFQISPKSAVVELEKVWQSALSFKAVHTQTRAVNFINLPITSFEADATNGTITIEVDCSAFGDDFYNGDIYASGTLCFDDGKNEKCSPYTPMTTTFMTFEDELVWSICIDNFDYNKDGNFSYLEMCSVASIGIAFQGKAIVSFDELQYFEGLESISEGAFSNCVKLTSIMIPPQVTEIGSKAFWDCGILPSIVIPENVTTIGLQAFAYCAHSQYGDAIFEIYCKAPTPPTIYLKKASTAGYLNVPFGPSACSTIYVPRASYDLYTVGSIKSGEYSSENWVFYKDKIQPYDFE